MPFECVWLLNCFDEIGGYWRYKDLAATKACTTFAATGRSTIDGRTIIGQNWDMGDSHYESVMLRIAPADDEIGGLVYTHPGIVGGMGMNRAGVSLVWNSLQASDAGSGVPVPFLIRLALRQPKLAEAIHATLRPLRAIGFNFVLASPDGAANIEASARDRRVTYVVRHLAHGNNYEAPELRALDLDRTFSSSSLVRAGRMRQLLDEHEGSLDIDRAMAILRDHAHYPGSICAHADPPFQSTNGTLASMVLVPADRAFLLAVGPPCGAEYERLVVA
jgi:isopenicillin-N N-acyltransferase-like protein